MRVGHTSCVVIGTAIWSLAFCGAPASAQDASARVSELMEVWNTGDVARLDTMVADDAVYVDVPNNHEFAGLDGFKEYVAHVHDWASEISIDVIRVEGTDRVAFAEWSMQAVQSRPIRGRVLEATNRPFTLRGLTLVETEHGKIKRAADYIDILGFVLQLGARVELPGGKVLQLGE